jgi:hypothetical protein
LVIIYSEEILLNVGIIRKLNKGSCVFTDHFRNFENRKVVQGIFGEKTVEALSSIPVEFTYSTLYMRVDYDGRLLINPSYFLRGNITDIYLDVIHELVHVKQVMNGKNCNHDLPYVERPLEIEAYRTAIEEARELGLDENRIYEYLDSDLIGDQELKQLASSLEISLRLD